MPRRGENIYKRKDGRWEGRFKSTEGKYISVYARSYREVRLRLEERRQQAQPNPRPMTVARLCWEWLAASERRLKPSSYVKYHSAIEGHIVPLLGGQSIHTLTRAQLERFVAQLSGSLSERTVRDIAKLLHAIWKDAAQQRLTGNLPSFDLLVPGGRKRQVDVLQGAECRHLETYLSREPDGCKWGVLLALYTGLRLGELCALRWRCIDLNAGTLQVTATMQRLQDVKRETGHRTNVICMPPKSPSSQRTIPLPDFLAEQLRRMRPASPDAYFLTGSPDRFVEPRALEYRFKRYLKECGLRSVNFHVLRHTFATRCVEVGFDTKSLSEILGHASVGITLSLYVHPTMEYKRENMNKLSFL